MCRACLSNGPDSIAGVSIKEYQDLYRDGTVFRPKLCTDLEARLLVALCGRSITIDDELKNRDDTITALFKDIGLEEKYGHGFERVLRGKLVNESLKLLRQAEKWSAFIKIDIGNSTRLMWNSNIVMANISNTQDARCWIEANRFDDQRTKDERRQKEHMKASNNSKAHSQTSVAEIALAEQLAKINISSVRSKTERRAAHSTFDARDTTHEARVQFQAPSPNSTGLLRLKNPFRDAKDMPAEGKLKASVRPPFGSGSIQQPVLESEEPIREPRPSRNVAHKQGRAITEGFQPDQPLTQPAMGQVEGKSKSSCEDYDIEETSEVEVDDDCFDQMDPEMMAAITKSLLGES